MKKGKARLSDFPSAIVIFVVAVIVFALIAPNFLSGTNLTNLVSQSIIPCILVVGVAMVIMSGGMDLSVGNVLALSGCVCALALRRDLPLAVSILLGMLTGAACGLINGFVISVMKIPSFITTLGMTNIAAGLVNTFSEKKPVYWEGYPLMDLIGTGTIAGFLPLYILLGAAIIGLTLFQFYFTRLRTNIYVLGGNEEVMLQSGGNVVKWKMITYAFSGLMAGCAGILMIARVGCADPTSGSGLEFSAVVGAVIGGNVQNTGKGTLYGALLGALTLATMRNGLSLLKVQTHAQMVVTGITLILGMLLFEMARNYDENNGRLTIKGGRVHA